MMLMTMSLRKHQLLPCLLLVIILLSSSVVAAIRLGPSAASYKPVDPNPFPSLDELEKTSIKTIDAIVDEVLGTEGGIITARYRPERTFLWRQWYNTVFFHGVPSAVSNMILALGFCCATRYFCFGDLNIGILPDGSHSFISKLMIFDKIWKTTLSLATFLLTFFVGQAYSFWQKIYDIGRSVQGRLNDVNLLLATHAARKKDGTYTPEARALLEDVAHDLKVFHILMWASYTKRFRVLLTDKGITQLVVRGCISQAEKDLLDSLDISKTQKHVVFLQMVVTKVNAARKSGLIEAGSGFETVFLEQIVKLRGTYGTTGDLTDGRIPLAYAHFVQILVDFILFTAPLAQYGELGIFSVLSVGILTIFYSGLLDLAKVLLDPLDSEDYRDGCVSMDIGVLIREYNGAVRRWMDGCVVQK